MKIRADFDDAKLLEGFTAENDLFQLADLSRRLSSLYTSLSHGTVSVLDGRWGTGKTTFVKMWAAELERSGTPAIYFDAFKADYVQDPFQAVSSAFIQAACQRRKTDDPAYKKYLSNTAAVAKRLAGVTLKAGVKLATLGAIGPNDLEALGELGAELGTSAGEITEEAVKALLERQASDQESFDALQQSLGELPMLLAPSSDAEGSDTSTSPLIVIIDELDRCRPDFALGILEVLKHFFRSDRLHFILVTNLDHLALSVSQRYGLSSAAAEYLHKFYDFVVYFEHRYGRHDDGNMLRYVDHVMTKLLFALNPQERRYLIEQVSAYARAFRLTLRQVEKIVANVALSYLAARDQEYRPAIFISSLCVLKALRPDLFLSAKQGNFDFASFEAFVNSGRWGEEFDHERLLRVFRYHSDPYLNEADPEYRSYGQELWRYSLDRLDVFPYLANSVIDRFGAPR